MILKKARIYSDGSLREGMILIHDGIIKSMIFGSRDDAIKNLAKENEDGQIIDCENRNIIPGIIDIHSHLRDMEQHEKESFSTGTKAAAFSGITTVFNMPNTKPPAITVDRVSKWMDSARDTIYVNVGFISGVPRGIELEEIAKIIKSGVIGFKIYPLGPLGGINWLDAKNIKKILAISSKFHVPIFIHPDWPLAQDKKAEIYQNYMIKKHSILSLHDNLYPRQKEAKYVNFILENYHEIISKGGFSLNNYPIVHFCHISCKESYSILRKTLTEEKNLKISFEITPHHLLLSNNIILTNDNFGKVLPPLRDELHSKYLYEELKEGNIELIGTDHAPHSLEEKSREYSEAPSGFPGFETYPLLLLNKTYQQELPLEFFVKAASENPARVFNLENKGFIKIGYDADLLILEKTQEYSIKPENFKTKAKYSPFEGCKIAIKPWKVFLKGEQINIDGIDIEPKGKILKRSQYNK